MKFAYFVTPHIGGTYTVYKSVRAGLAAHGVEVRWLGVGSGDQASMRDSRWATELAHGTVVGGDAHDEQAQGMALITHLKAENYDGVFVNAACNRVHSNVIRHLDADIRRIMTVHTITVATYAGARVLRDHVHSTICVSPRIREDLLRKNGFSPSQTMIIPNAIDIAPFLRHGRLIADGSPLRVLSLGRIIDRDKGVLWLPKIMDQLSGQAVNLTVAGDGPDLAELKRRCAHLGERVRFLGRIPPEQVPEVLSEHDVFIFPSRFEGLPLSLVEAMAAGCVPVASRIKGVTDFVLRDGADGLLFDMGDVRGAAQAVAALAKDRAMLTRLAASGQQRVAGRFDLSGMARDYFDVVQDVLASPREIRNPLPIETWSYPAGLRPGLRTYLPEGVKKWLRLWRERFA